MLNDEWRTATSQAAGKLPESSSFRTRRFFELIDKLERCLCAHRHRHQRSRKLHITVRTSQPPYSQLYAQFDRAQHALRQPEHTFAMKIARLLSTSTRKAGHTPRLPPPTRDVAAEVLHRVRTRDFKRRCAREHGQNSNSHARPRRRRAQHTQRPRTAARATRPLKRP